MQKSKNILSIIVAVLFTIIATVSHKSTNSVYAGDNGGSTLDFDGTNDYIELPAGAAFTNGTGTIEFWLKSDDLSSPHHGVYISSSTDFHLDGFCTVMDSFEAHLSTSNNVMGVVYQDGVGSTSCAVISSIQNTPPTEILPGHWYHLAATFDASGMMTAYLNGNIEQSVDLSGFTFAGHSPILVRIGRPGADIRYLDGQIEEVRIWDTVRTQTEIQQTMFTALSGDELGLRAYWKLDDNSGQMVTDTQISGSYPGTLGADATVGADDPTWIATSTAPIGDDILAAQTEINGVWSVVPSAASGGLMISNQDFLHNEGDDIIWGHNDLTGNTAAETPNEIEQRWSRVWYCDLYDAGSNGGNITLTFNFDDAGMGNGSPPSGDASNYKLLQRAGISGPFSIIAAATAYDTDQNTVTFSNVAASSLSGYITLGTTDATISPTAVKLQGIGVDSDKSVGITLLTAGLISVIMLVFSRKHHQRT